MEKFLTTHALDCASFFTALLPTPRNTRRSTPKCAQSATCAKTSRRSTTTLTASSANAVFGQTVTFTAQVQDDGGAITDGSVSFTDSAAANAFATSTLDGTGSATVDVSSLGLGDHTITAATHHMRVDYSMFEGFKVRGNARKVYSRGELIVDGGRFVSKVGRGKYLRREPRGGC